MVTLVNRAKVSTTTTGTGTITLGSAESGYQSFADAGVVDADVVRYVIEDGTNWEIGTGTYTATGTTLSRTVLESSNAGAAINLSGSAVVFVGAAAEDLAPEKVGTITGTTLDLTSGNVFSYTPTAETTFVFSNPPATGTALGFTLELNGEFIDGGYDLANAEPPAYGRFSVSAQETVPSGIFFKPDGLKMYVIGNTGDDVNEYDLSTAWDVSTASYLQNFSVAAQETTPTGIFFKPDGTKMYVIGQSGDDVNEYDLSTAWDVSTASYLQNFSIAAQEANPTGMFFKPDGTKMYILGAIGDDVNEYDLSTAWDVSTASYLQNFSIAAQEMTPSGIFFKPDGTKMYISGQSGDAVNEYDLSTAWDVSSASYLQNFSVVAQETTSFGIFFKPDGTKMYISGQSGDSVFSYTLSTAWDVSAASFDVPTEGYFSVAAQETNPTGMFFKPDGTKMYVIGYAGDDVNEYDLSTAWDVTSASYLQNFSVAAQEATPQSIFFKPDGTKMYVIGFTGDDVNEYNLSTAWDVSSASYLQNFSVAAQETTPTGIFFKPDGLKMYVIGFSGQDVNEYDLSTAWDITTASYLQNFSVAAQESGPNGIFFKPDGLKMYVIGNTGDDVNEYDLSTAWDISSASYLQNFSVAAQEANPQGMFFKPDGTKMYVIGLNGDAVWQYSTGFVGDATFTYPASVEWPSGTPPTAPADGETDLLRFLTQDGGTTYYGRLIGDNFS
jgi:sugar lactone lactonase YvrE